MQRQYRFKSIVKCKHMGKQNVFESNEVVISVIDIPSRQKKSKQSACKSPDWCHLMNTLCGLNLCFCNEKRNKSPKRKK